MRYLAKILIITTLPFCLLACSKQKEKTDEELCNCVKYQMNGEMDLAITEECVDAFRNKFGEQLIGMEEWFVKYCPAPDIQIQEEGEVIQVKK